MTWISAISRIASIYEVISIVQDKEYGADDRYPEGKGR